MYNGKLIGDRMRIERKKLLMSQKDIADKLGISQSMYSHMEIGMRDIPTDILIALCQLFDVSADYLLGTGKDYTDLNLHFASELESYKGYLLHKQEKSSQ